MEIAELGLKVDSRGVVKATKDLDKLERQGGKTEKRAIGMGRAFGNAFGAIAAGALFKNAIANTIEQERVTAQLEQTLRSTGRFTPELSQSMQDYATSLQQVTTFGDEAVVASQAMLLTFTQIGNEEFPRAQEAILDVATAMGIDLKSAAIQVGKALNDPLTGLSALSRSGITFSQSQKDAVKQMVAMGETAKAQRLILDELETQFGGSARAARDTFGGALKSLSNTMGDLLEGDGSVGAATQAVNDLNEALNDPNIKKGLDAMVAGFLSVIEFTAKASANIAGFATWLGEAAARAQGFKDAEDQVLEKEQELEDIRERIARAEKSGHPENVKRNQEILAQKQKELELLKEALFVGGKQAGVVKPNVPVKKPQGKDPKTPPTPTGLTEAQKAAIRARDSLASLEQSLIQQNAIFGQSETAVLAYRLSLGDLSDEVRALGASGQQLAQDIIAQAQALESAQLQEQYQSVTGEIEKQIIALGRSSRELAIHEAQSRLSANATQDMKDRTAELAGALFDEQKALEERNSALSTVESLVDQAKTAQQEYLEVLKEIALAEQSGAATAQEAAIARQQASENLKDSLKDTNDFAVQAAKNIQDAFADGLFDVLQGDTDEFADNFIRTMDRIVANVIAQKAALSLFGDEFSETGELGGFLGDIFGTTKKKEQAPVAGAVAEIGQDSGASLVSGFVENQCSCIQDGFGDMGDVFSDELGNVGELFNDGLNGLGDIFSDLPSQLGSLFGSSGGQDAASGLLSSASGLFDDFSFGDLFSFDGGGFTGSGSRSGGVDGKGGFPAILHPNETVIDHTKGQTTNNNQATTVNNYFTINGPTDRRSQAQIAQSAFSGAQRALNRNG